MQTFSQIIENVRNTEYWVMPEPEPDKIWWERLSYIMGQFLSAFKFRISLVREFQHINNRCFSGLLKAPRLEWMTDELKYKGESIIDGKEVVQYGQVLGSYRYGSSIKINSLHESREDVIRTLIHEMSHQFIREVLGICPKGEKEDHGSLFQSTFKKAIHLYGDFK